MGKGGTTLTKLVTGPGHWGPNTIMAHIAGQVAMVIPFPASFHHPGRKLASLGQAESEQIASWPKNGSYSGKWNPSLLVTLPSTLKRILIPV